MTESERIVRRKLELKRQAAALVRAELQDLIFEKALLRYQNQLAERIAIRKFDRELSAKIDAVQGVLDRKGCR